MAKDNQKDSKLLPDQTEIARDLFVRFWTPPGPGTGIDGNALAALCFDGAAMFLKVAAQVREGRAPSDILDRGVSPAQPSMSNVAIKEETQELASAAI